jgi:electron transfer flavoprotein beta subunit
MRVAICCRGVPIDVPLESASIVHGDIQYRDTDFYINEIDAYALEAALFLKNTYQAETVALTVGPLRAQEVLYIAVAKGINQVLRIDGETTRPELIASGLMKALREIRPDLVLVGVQSEDWMGGEVGGYLAQGLEMGLAFAVIELGELNENQVRVKKEIGGGKKTELTVKLPAVLCVQSGIQPLRYLSMMKRQKARNTPIKMYGGLDVEGIRGNIPGIMAYTAVQVSLPVKEGRAEMITGDRSEKAAKLLEIITGTI